MTLPRGFCFSIQLGFSLLFCKIPAHYGKERKKPLQVCRETHDENSKDRCIQVKEYRGMVPCAFWKWEEGLGAVGGGACIAISMGGGKHQKLRLEPEPFTIWLFPNNRPNWAKEGHGWYPKLFSYQLSQGCSSAIHYQDASPAQRPDQQFSLLWED